MSVMASELPSPRYASAARHACAQSSPHVPSRSSIGGGGARQLPLSVYSPRPYPRILCLGSTRAQSRFGCRSSALRPQRSA